MVYAGCWGVPGVCQGVVSSVNFVNENYDKKCSVTSFFQN